MIKLRDILNELEINNPTKKIYMVWIQVDDRQDWNYFIKANNNKEALKIAKKQTLEYIDFDKKITDNNDPYTLQDITDPDIKEHFEETFNGLSDEEKLELDTKGYYLYDQGT